jgi:hypothetical protein
MADTFSTGVLMGVVQDLKVPRSALLDRYFGSVMTFDTEEVYFDVIPGKRRIAPFVSPNVAGQVVDSKGFSTKTFKPAYLKDKRVFQPARAFKRAVGEQVGGASLSPTQRMQLHLATEMQDQIDMVTRRLEVMASEALRLGTVTVAGDNYPSVTVNYGRTAGNTIANLTSTARWGDSAPVPLDNLQTWALLGGQNSGAHPVDVVMGTTAWAAFRKDTEVKARLLAINTMNQNMEQASAEEGLRYMGTLDGFNIFVYAGWYIDPATGNETEIWPAKSVALLSSAVEGTRAFGAIQDEELGFVAAQYAPKSWTEKDPAVRYLMMQSAPLTVLGRPDAVVYCAQVTA